MNGRRSSPIMEVSMGAHLEELTLFPLNLVLFPNSFVRLHVFESRYKQLVQDCLETGSSFGLVLIRRGSETNGIVEPYLVGTKAKIFQTYPFEDGTMDIIVQGESRFRIRSLDETHPCLVAKVEPVTEQSFHPDPLADDLAEETKANFLSWCQALFPSEHLAVKVAFPDDLTTLSFQIANWLPVENIRKQQFLEMTDTVDRLHTLNELLGQQIVAIAVGGERSPVTLDDLRGYIYPN